MRRAPATDVRAAEPGALEVAGLLAAAVAVHLLVLIVFFTYEPTLLRWLDNVRYVTIARAIHDGQWACDADCTWHLWGFPFAIAAVANVFGTSDLTALVAISFGTALATAVLTQRLYGGWVAAAAVAISPIGIEIAARGGSEPIFMALSYGGLLAWRRRAVALGSALAVSSAAVRPVGVLVVGALALDALVDRRWRDLFTLAGVALALTIVYLIAVGVIAGNPIATSAGYLDTGWGPLPIGWPFAGFLASLRPILVESPRQAIVTCGWMVLVCVCLVRQFWRPSSVPPAERYYAIGYTVFLVCGTHVGLADSLSRFALPALPLLLDSVGPWIPRRRWVWWAVALAVGLLGAVGTGRLYQSYGY